MFRNHFKIAWRNLIKGKTYSAINILGLAVGIGSCLIILLYVRKELSYDKFHHNADRIHRVSLRYSNNNGSFNIAWAPSPVGARVRSSIPEIERVVQILSAELETIVERNNLKAYETGFLYTTPAIFEVFDFPLVSGEASSSLTQPYHLLLSERMASKYFPGEDPIGHVLTINNKHTYKVAGVFKDVPDNSHIQFDFLASSESLYADGLERESWHSGGAHTYVLLHPQADRHAFERKVHEFADKEMAGPFNFQQGKTPPVGLVTTPLTDIHLFARFKSEMMPQGDITYVYIFSAIAFLILVIACINYTNLATAMAVARAREVGIQKVHGAQRSELVRQYLSESFLFVGTALIVAVALAEYFLPYVSEVMQRQIDIRYTDPTLIMMFAGIWITVGLGAGIYPALYLSGFNAARTLKSQYLVQSKGTLRKALIIFQLAVSMVLITCTLTIQQQMSLTRHSRAGFDQSQVIMIPTRNEIGEGFVLFKERLSRHPAILSVTTTSFEPGEPGMINFFAEKDFEGHSGEETIVVDGMIAGFDFEKTLGVKLIQGRSFDAASGTDLEQAVILNETAVRMLGWADAVGKTILREGKTPQRVVGVIADFHYKSLRDKISPLIISPTEKASRFIAVRIAGRNIPEAIREVEKAWKEVAPQLPLTYSFLDDSFDAMYRTELRLTTLVTTFALLAISIACLGLFGLSAFMARQRTKEIGIRKVLGATALSIIAMLTRDFVKWACLGLLIAVPCVQYAMGVWLQSFEYKVEVGITIYILAGAVALLLIVLTTSWQSLQTALRNPVETLRND